MNDFRLFVVGITSAQIENMKAMIEPAKDIIDGLVFVVDDKASEDGTRDYLEANKKAGKVIHRSWTNDFDIQFTEILRSGGLRHNLDYLILRDSQERLNPDFAKSLQESVIRSFQLQNITCCYQRSKPAIFKYTESLFFFNTPHCGLYGIKGNVIDLAKTGGFEDDRTYLYSLRVGDESWFKNGLHYTLTPRSNHMALLWSEPQRFPAGTDTIKLYTEHEQFRLKFLDDWFAKFQKLPTVETVTEYMKTDPNSWDAKFLDWFNYELTPRNHYRLKILNEPIESIEKNQWDWSLRNYLWPL